jgi:hypothetical protein
LSYIRFAKTCPFNNIGAGSERNDGMTEKEDGEFPALRLHGHGINAEVLYFSQRRIGLGMTPHSYVITSEVK